MRIKIMELIYEDDTLSMNDLAKLVGLTNSAISMHVSKLEEAGLIKINSTAGKRGVMKIIHPRYERLMIDLVPIKEKRQFYQDDIKIGYYTTHKVSPTCGIATVKKIVGEFDDVRYFTFPERFDAGTCLPVVILNIIYPTILMLTDYNRITDFI